MKLSTLKYLLVYITPVVVFFSIRSADWWSYLAVALLFGVLPFMELFSRGSNRNFDEVEEEAATNNRAYDLIIYGLLPAQYLILVYFLVQIGQEGLPLYVRAGMTIAFGLSCGVLGINAAHELGHRNTRYEQLMSKALLLSTLYMHFFIEHNRGHHKNVSTEEDPATSRYGETLYGFYVRTIRDSWLSAWRLEADRLRKEGLLFWSWNNEMLRFQVIQLAFVSVIYVVFGFFVLCHFLAGAAIGALLLETVNYIEHYGLMRRKTGGRYERTLPAHSWNSNHPIGRLMLLELSRHSDHHFMANRKYQVLRHFDDSPQMPAGYPGMMLLALIPPLWFRVMHRQIEKYRAGGVIA